MYVDYLTLYISGRDIDSIRDVLVSDLKAVSP